MENDRQKTIKKLLQNFHLNVIDRKIFIEHPLTIGELKSAIIDILKENNFFPSRFCSWDSSVFNYDGYMIEKSLEGKYFVHFQISGAWMNLIKSETFSFGNMSEAIDFYIEKELKENIDGITINNAP